MNTFDNFIVGESNYHAYTFLKELSLKDDVQGKQIFLVGPVSSGKTHLLESTAEAIRCRGRAIIYDSAIKFSKDIIPEYFIESLKNWKTSYGSNPKAVILDDVHLLKGREQMQLFLCEFFEFIKNYTKCMVVVSIGTRDDFNLLHENVRNYINDNTLLELFSPDCRTKEGLVKSFFWESKITIDQILLSYIVEQLPDDVREIRGHCNRLTLAVKMGSLSTVEDVNKYFLTAH